MARQFHTGDLVSVVIGFPLPPNGFDGIYALLGYMAGEDLMTHQLPDAAEKLLPYLLAQHPWLVDVVPPKTEAEAERWLSELSALHGEQHEVSPPPSSAWGKHDPIKDYLVMNPTGMILPIVLPGTEQEQK